MEIDASRLRLLTPGLLIIGLLWTLSFVVRIVRWRLYFRKLQGQGMPMPPHNFLLGHLHIITKLMNQIPSDAHPLYLPDMIRRTYPDLGPNYYLDLYPFAPSMLVLASPKTAQQVSVEHVLPKYPNLKDFLRPLTDALDLVTMEGATWKKWRAVFNPGFSASHLITMVPAIAKEVEIFCELLREHAEKQDIFRLKDMTDYLTLDVISRVALDTRFDCQRNYSPVVHSLRTQIKWFSFGLEPNPFARYNPFRPLVHWYHSRIVNAYISKELDRRVEMRRTADTSSVGAKRARTIIDLALNTYNAEESGGGSSPKSETLDPFFKKICMSQVKLFLFGGHDTTSSAICFHLYLLSQNPDKLKNLRAELDAVFGKDPSQVAPKLSEKPHLISQLPYTTAVIKESLRLFPTVVVSRQGEEGYSVTDQLGRKLPTGGFLVFPNTHTTQHDPALWPSVEAFLPERWLAPEGDPLHPVKDAHRPFHIGPRACVGVELAMLEMKTALAMVARSFDFRPAYDEVYRERDGGAVRELHGHRAYQTDIMQPRGDFPCRVEVV